MAGKQTRRSISVSKTTYDRLKLYCEANNISMSQVVETLVAPAIGSTPGPAAAPRKAKPVETEPSREAIYG